jgi:hypothetical protein
LGKVEPKIYIFLRFSTFSKGGAKKRSQKYSVKTPPLEKVNFLAPPFFKKGG